MFNQFQYLFNHLLVKKKQNTDTDSHTVCNAQSTLTPTVQFKYRNFVVNTQCISK